MDWQMYRNDEMDRESWDAHLKTPHGTVGVHVLRLGDKWCAYVSAPSRYGDPMVRHSNATDFIFDRHDRAAAMAMAEALAAEVRVSLENEKPRVRQ